ncbi:MAG: hypothetical protein ABR536_06625 [Solirubrobacterales bacterium]
MSLKSRRNGIDEMYTGAVRVAASLILAFGIIIVVATVVHGGGPLSTGVVLGLGFIALGSARLWLAFR